MEGKRQWRLNDVESYRISFHLSNFVWDIVLRWGIFEKDTVGKQLVRAIDSISANIAEGFGRHGKKDKIKFYRIARGSLFECLDFNEKAKVRKLITTEQHQYILEQLQQLPKSINSLIKHTNQTLQD